MPLLMKEDKNLKMFWIHPKSQTNNCFRAVYFSPLASKNAIRRRIWLLRLLAELICRQARHIFMKIFVSDCCSDCCCITYVLVSNALLANARFLLLKSISDTIDSLFAKPISSMVESVLFLSLLWSAETSTWPIPILEQKRLRDLGGFLSGEMLVSIIFYNSLKNLWPRMPTFLNLYYFTQLIINANYPKFRLFAYGRVGDWWFFMGYAGRGMRILRRLYLVGIKWFSPNNNFECRVKIWSPSNLGDFKIFYRTMEIS